MKNYQIDFEEKVISNEAWDMLNAISECAARIEDLNFESADNEKEDKAMAKTGVAFAYFVHCALETIKVQTIRDIEWKLSQQEKEKHEANNG